MGLYSAMRRILFVCTANQCRSRTAEDLYVQDPRYQVISAGTDVCEAEPDERPVTRELVDWAELIVAMEPYHKRVLIERFPGCESKIVVLNIPDRFCRGDPPSGREARTFRGRERSASGAHLHRPNSCLWQYLSGSGAPPFDSGAP